MANPRKIVAYGEVLTKRATYKTDGVTILFDVTKVGGSVSANNNLAVTLSADNTVALCADADPVLGVLEKVEGDGMATIIVEGYVPFKKGNAATLTRNSKIIGALGAASAKGYVRNAAAATLAEVAVGVGKVQDVSDSVLVWVKF